eukprot:SAG31_NODE_1901_length_6958_cov_5.749526_4_plen_74_part_00
MANLENDVAMNKISDVTPLRHRANLKELDVRLNQISDLTSLTDLATLQQLWTNGKQIAKDDPSIRVLKEKKQR